MDININICNKEDIEYLSKIEDTKLDKILKTAISIGLKSIQLSEVNLDCHSYIDPIKDIVKTSTSLHEEKLYTIENKLNDILHIKTNSSRKGRLSEEICRDILIKNYPSWSFLDVSKEGYEADCKAFETPIGQILYEFKNYDYNVNRDQVNKFIRDLNHTNIKYGIFVSNTSGIVGKKNIEWEIINEKLIIYVSNMGFEGFGCIIGTELLLSLINIDILNKDKWLYHNNINLNEIFDDLKIIIENLNKNIELYTKHKALISEQRIKINNIIDLLEKNAFDNLLELKNTFNKMIKISDEITMEHKIINAFDKDKFLENNKNKDIYAKLLECNHKYNIKTDNNNLYFYENEILICFTKQKNKIELIFPIYNHNISIDLKYEKIKSNQICIELKDNIGLWNLISYKLK